MDEKKYFLQLLESFDNNFPVKSFYNPDGLVLPQKRNTIYLPNDRLLFILDGTKVEPMSLNGKLQEVNLKKGDCYLIRKNIWEAASRTQPHTLFYIMLRGGFLRLAQHTISHPDDPWDTPLVYHTAMLSESLTKAFSLLKTVDSFDQAILIIKLIIKLAKDEIIRSSSQNSKAQNTFERVRNYIEVHYSEAITRESIASRFGLNACYVSQIFQKFTEHSFNDYLTECRINQAQFLLLHTEATIKEIAYDCGFANDVYFVRRFRERIGMSPGKFRIQNQ